MPRLVASVVVPTHNRLTDLVVVLRALRAQSFSSDAFEVVVVNDGSADDTADVLESLKGEPGVELRPFNQMNQGPAAARNRGVREAQGRLIAFIDDDCLPEPDWLKTLVAALPDDQKCAGIGGRVVRHRDSLISRYIDDRGGVKHSVENGVVEYLVTANALFRRELLLEVGGFDERLRWASGEDVELCQRLRERGFCFLTAEDAVVRHKHRDTLRGIFKMYRLHGRGAYALAQIGRTGFRKRRLRGLAKKLWELPSYLARRDLTLADRLGFCFIRLIHIVADQIGYASGGGGR